MFRFGLSNISHSRWFDKEVKFPHSPILHYAFSSWIEKTMTKTIHCHWETDLFYNSMGLCRNFAEIININKLFDILTRWTNYPNRWLNDDLCDANVLHRWKLQYQVANLETLCSEWTVIVQNAYCSCVIYLNISSEAWSGELWLFKDFAGFPPQGILL